MDTINAKEEHKPGSTIVKCKRKECTFDKFEFFDVGKDGIRVSMKAMVDGVRLIEVKLKNHTTGVDYSLDGSKVSNGVGHSKTVIKGRYQIIPIYRYVDYGREPHNLTLFVHW